MSTERDDPLERAQMKQAQGRGLKNSELALLRHAEKVQVFKSKPRANAPTISEADTRTSLQAGRDALTSAAGRPTDLTDLTALTARVAVLEDLLAGLSRQTITYCSGGSSSSKTIVMS